MASETEMMAMTFLYHSGSYLGRRASDGGANIQLFSQHFQRMMHDSQPSSIETLHLNQVTKSRHTHTHTSMHRHKHTHTHTCMYAQTLSSTCIRMHVCMHTRVHNAHTHSHLHTCPCTHAHVCMHECTHARTGLHAHIHTHTHTSTST